MSQPFAFDPLDPGVRRDPYALYARGRREHPVYLHEGLPLRVASVFRYADVQAILRDDAAFSNSFPLNRQLAELAGEEPPPSMLGSDGEVHARLRGLVNKAFTPRMRGSSWRTMRGVKALFTRPRSRAWSAPSVPSMLGTGTSSSVAPGIWRWRGNEFEKPTSSRRIACTSA